MERKENILSGVLKFSVSSWVNLIIGFLSIIITTRLLTPEVYGLVNLFMASADALMYIISMGLDGALLRFYVEPPSKNTTNQLMYRCLVTSALFALLLGSGITLTIGDYASCAIFGFPCKVLTALLFMYSLERLILRILNISFRMSFNSFHYNIQNILLNCAMRITVIIGSFFFSEGFYIVLLITVVYCCLAVIYLVAQRKNILPYDESGSLNFSIQWKGFAEFYKYAALNSPLYFVTYINNLLTLEVIRIFSGSAAVGIFSSTSIFSSIVAALSGGFSTYWLAYVYNNYKTEQRSIAKMHSYSVLIVIVLASLLVLFRDAIYLFIGDDYHESKLFYSLILVAPLLNFILITTSVGIGVSKKNQYTLIASVVSVLINLGGCWLFLPVFGVVGAAIANAIAGIVRYFMLTLFGQKQYRSIDDLSKSLIGTTLIIMVLVAPLVVSNFLQMTALILILNLVFLALYKKEFRFVGMKCIEFTQRHFKHSERHGRKE